MGVRAEINDVANRAGQHSRFGGDKGCLFGAHRQRDGPFAGHPFGQAGRNGVAGSQ